MNPKVGLKKIDTGRRGGIPAIVMTTIVLTLALIGIVLVQKYANAPPSGPVPAQTQTVP